MRILVIEDEIKTADYLRQGLSESGYVVDVAGHGVDGLHLAQEHGYDLIVLDVNLPGLNGWSILQSIRSWGETPVLMLTAHGLLDDKVRGFDLGADDYLVKPFLFAELLARIQAILRRTTGSEEVTRLTCGDLTMDLLRHEVTRAGRKIELQPREHALLEYLMRYRGQILSKTMILEHVWDYRFDPQTNVVDVLVCRLRNKIDREFSSKLIQTIRGIGYILELPEKNP